MRFNMLVIVTTVLFLMSMPLPEASRVLPAGGKQNMMKNNQFFESLQVQGDQVLPPISVAPKPNPPTIPPSTISQKAFASDHTMASPLLRRELRRGYVTPSAPNPRTLIPASATGHKAAPLPGTLNKSAPPPSMPNGQLRRGYVTPSAPNPRTLIPATTTGNKAAPSPGTLKKSAPPPSMPNGQLRRGYVTPSAPNPRTLIPATTTGLKAAPSPGTLNKSAPPPSMPNGYTSYP